MLPLVSILLLTPCTPSFLVVNSSLEYIEKVLSVVELGIGCDEIRVLHKQYKVH